MNPRPSGYEPDELPGCSTPQSRAYNGPDKPIWQGLFVTPRKVRRHFVATFNGRLLRFFKQISAASDNNVHSFAVPITPQIAWGYGPVFRYGRFLNESAVMPDHYSR